MKKQWDEALRSLARRSRGPFRALAYGVTGDPEGGSELSDELRNLLRRDGFGRDGEVVAEVADPFTGATQRTLFASRVVPWIRSERRSPAPPPASTPAQDRRDLESLAAGLAGFLDELDRSAPGARTSFRLLSETESGEEAEAASLILVRRFEDLGCDAEGIAAALTAIVVAGGHLRIANEELDTRTREGRAAAALAIRLGTIKAARARERSLEDVRRRREGLQVYGPVPFGFLRRGQGLVPVEGQLDTVARARELARRGASLLETALALNREQRWWKDGTAWTWRRVRQVIHNPIYDRALAEKRA